MRRLLRCSVLLTFALAAVSGAAAAQDHTSGAGRAELGAFPGGGIVFTRSTDNAAPDFTNYTFGASFTWNATRWIGLETEAGFGIGGSKSVSSGGRTLRAQPMPDTIVYTGSVVVNLTPSDRAVVPYATVGLGTFRIVKREGTEDIGINDNHTLFAASAGGGLKFYCARAWGLRADYRALIIAVHDEAPAFFGRDGPRYGHRIALSAFATF